MAAYKPAKPVGHQGDPTAAERQLLLKREKGHRAIKPARVNKGQHPGKRHVYTLAPPWASRKKGEPLAPPK